MLDPGLEGRVLPPITMRIEKKDILEFCGALATEDPVYDGSESAGTCDYVDTPAPITFCTSLLFKGYPELWKMLREFGMDTGRLLHSKEEYDCFSPIYPGDDLQFTLMFDFVHSTATTDMITIRNTVSKQGEPIMIIRTTLISPRG